MRPYLVWVDGGEGEPLFIESKCPRYAVEKVAAELVPVAERYAKLKVKALVSGARLDNWRHRVSTYHVFLTKQVARVEAKP